MNRGSISASSRSARNPTPVVYSRFLNDLNIVARPPEKAKLSFVWLNRLPACSFESPLPQAPNEVPEASHLPANHPLTILANASLRASQRSNNQNPTQTSEPERPLFQTPPVSGRWPAPEAQGQSMTAEVTGGSRRATAAAWDRARAASQTRDRRSKDGSAPAIQVFPVAHVASKYIRCWQHSVRNRYHKEACVLNWRHSPVRCSW